MQQTMKRTIVTFGVLTGTIIVLYFYLIFLILGDTLNVRQLELAQWLGYIRYLVLLLGVVMAMVAYRREQRGPLGYLRLFGIGALVAVITACFVGVMEYIYIAFINPGFYEQYSRLTLEGMRTEGATAAAVERMRRHQESFAWMADPVATGLFYVLETSVIGTVMASIAAAATRRKEAPAPLEEPISDQRA